ncbi:alpha-isopropylmalate synthase regulatory domain-containing protein, partial [Staphylococcus warneri]
ELIDYRIDSITEGADAQAEVHVSLIIEGTPVNGIGIDHDILQASCKAYIEAHAKYISETQKKVGIHS